MGSQRQIAANQKNALQSTGPHNTDTTRHNSLKHGILSSESLILSGDGLEDINEFEALWSDINDYWNPVGRMEDLLVDNIVMLVWRWRRVVKYENATIRVKSDEAFDHWKDNEIRRHDLKTSMLMLPQDPWQSPSDLENVARELKLDLKALKESDPMAIRPELWFRTLSLIEEKFEISIQATLGLESEWDEYEEFDPKDVQQLIEVTCQTKSLSQKEFWDVLKQRTFDLHEKVVRQIKGHLRARERFLLAASLPAEKALAKVQRYESHISRQFYKAIHELQRLQAVRMGNHNAVPVAVDLEVSMDSEKSPN